MVTHVFRFVVLLVFILRLQTLSVLREWFGDARRGNSVGGAGQGAPDELVANDGPGREDVNMRSFKELLALTSGSRIPIIVQLNKIDVAGAMPPAILAKHLGIPAGEIHPSVAVTGEGVIEVFHAITAEVLKIFFVRSTRK